MKKFFSIILIALLSFGYAQAQIDTLYSQDFGSGIPASWTNQGTANSVPNPWVQFKYTHVGSQGAYAAGTGIIQSPTSANGFIIFDSDSLDNGGHTIASGPDAGQPDETKGPANIPQVVMLTTNAIPVATPYCKLSFYQYFRTLFSVTAIGISTDGVNFTMDTINSNVGVNDNTAPNSKIEVDLTPYLVNGGAGGGPATNVYIQFFMYGEYYFWMIDDIMITTLPNNDMAVVDASAVSLASSLGIFYSSIPLSQATNDSLVAISEFVNAGQLPQPNAKVSFTQIYNGTVIATNTATPLPLLDYGIDTTAVSATFDNQGIGQYIVAIHASSDSTDYDLTNNDDSVYYSVTDSVYSISTSHTVVGGYYLLSNPLNINGPLGVVFEVENQDTVTSITTAILGGTGNTSPGAVIEGQIYPLTVSSTAITYNSPIVSTFPKTLTTGELGNGDFSPVTMVIDNSTGSAVLPAGVYWAAIEAISTADSQVIIASTADEANGFPAGEASSGQGIGLVSQTDAPYVTMNFGHNFNLLYASWTRSPGISPVRPGEVLTFHAQTNATAGASYHWVVTDSFGYYESVYAGNSFKDTLLDNSGVGVDNYTVCLTVSQNGDSASYCNNVNVQSFPAGINTVAAPLSYVSMVPNPTTGNVTINANGVSGAMTITVVDLLGDVVKTYNEDTNGSFSKSYNVSDLSNGIYLVRIDNNGNSVIKKLSVSKQ